MTVDQVLNAQPTTQIQVSNGPTVTSQIPFDTVKVCFFRGDQDLSLQQYASDRVIQLDLENAEPGCEFQISAFKGSDVVGVFRGTPDLLVKSGEISLVHRYC